MTRTLRGAWSRRWTLLPLLLMTAVLVAGIVSVIGFADAASTSTKLAVPLVLLGVVAVPASGRELARVRRDEIALARLRGLGGAELVIVLALEPVLVLLLGALLGLVGGAVGISLASATLIDAPDAGLGLVALTAGLAVVVAGLAGVLVGMWSTLDEPLSDQVRSTVRPRLAGIGAVFVDVLLVAAALVAVYRSNASTGSEVDVVVLAGPALVGLAIGQVVIWLVALASAPIVRLTAHRGLVGFLAARRLTRVADAVAPLRILVGAGVIGVLAWTASTQVGDWTESSARLRAGAPLQVTVEGQSSDALNITRELDPSGDYLMAAVMVEDRGPAAARRAFVDTGRYEAVVGDFLAATPAGSVGQRLEELRGQARGMPVFATDSAQWPDDPPGILSPGAKPFAATVVGRLPALPLVEGAGLLADLAPAIAFDTSTIPAATVLVLARADTPAALLEELSERAGHPVRSVDSVRARFAADGGQAQAQIYLLMAGCCLLVALLALAGAVSGQRSARVRELAALRLVGVSRRHLARAGLAEDAWVALGAVVATTIGALAAVRLLLAHLDLVTEPLHATPLQTGVDPLPLVAVAVATAVAVLVAGRRSRAGWAERSRPTHLREDAR